VRNAAGAWLLLAGLVASVAAGAESALPLEAFGAFVERRGLVYDASGEAVGEAETPRLLDADARVVRRLPDGGVEIATRFDLGPWLSARAGPFLPRTRFWLDPARDVEWLGHEATLFPGGPELAVIRDGVSRETLLAGDGGG